jgi:hypothetical protein
MFDQSVDIVYAALAKLPGGPDIQTLLKEGMKAAERTQMKGHARLLILKLALERFAAGKDGVSGTADDRISEHTLKKLRAVLENDVLEIIAGIAIEAVNGEFTLPRQCTSCCFKS